MNDFERLERPEHYALHRRGVVNSGVRHLVDAIFMAFPNLEKQQTQAIEQTQTESNRAPFYEIADYQQAEPKPQATPETEQLATVTDLAEYRQSKSEENAQATTQRIEYDNQAEIDEINARVKDAYPTEKAA